MKPAVHERSVPTHGEPFGVVLRLRPVIELSGEQLLELSSLNDDLRLELTAEGELTVMTLAGGVSGRRNFELAVQLGTWTKRDGTGVAFDSSGGFILPNGAIRAPDASWIERSRYEALTPEQREKYPPSARTSSSNCARRAIGLAPCRRRWQSTWRTGRGWGCS
jgi:putative restriction endonuclease